MEIFTLNENTQGYDYEHYNHWVQSRIVNYYATEELAKDAIQELIKDLEYDCGMAWHGELGDGRNIITLESGYSGNWKAEVVNKYFIKTINVITSL